MPRQQQKQASSKPNGAIVGYEAQLWQMADALRGSMDAAEYKHLVLGLLFLKQGADPEEYRAVNIFWVPPEARWPHLKAQAKQPTIGQLVDDAMAAIERDTPTLKSVLPKDYTRPALDKQPLGQLIDLITGRSHAGEARSLLVSEGVVDIFSAAGLAKPDISILSEEFLAEVKSMPHRNLAVELLESSSPAESVCAGARTSCRPDPSPRCQRHDRLDGA